MRFGPTSESPAPGLKAPQGLIVERPNLKSFPCTYNPRVSDPIGRPSDSSRPETIAPALWLQQLFAAGQSRDRLRPTGHRPRRCCHLRAARVAPPAVVRSGRRPAIGPVALTEFTAPGTVAACWECLEPKVIFTLYGGACDHDWNLMFFFHFVVL